MQREITITVRGNKEQVLQIVRHAANGLPKTRQVLVRIGLAMQGVISRAFKRKSDGGLDATGAKWKPLSPVTVAKKKRTAPQNARRILREHDLLLHSLEPAVRPENAPSFPPRRPFQVFRVGPRGIEIGTSRPFALLHHRGTRRLPRRPLWPDPRQWPASWWARVLAEARAGAMKYLAEQMRS
jgi:hypothetical protein